MDNKTIEIQHLNKSYGKKQVLYDLNLTIDQGMFGLLGRNGAGKTTLMKTLTTLLRKNDGTVTVCGIPIENVKEVRNMIGYLPQDFSIYPSMNVAEAMDYLGILSGMSPTVRKERTELLLKRVNLTEHRNKKIKALSGGMKRRLGIAQALLNNPKVLIVDEPTAGLDPEERIRFRNLLSEVAEDRIVLLSTHIVGDIEASCENIAILDEGRLLYSGTVADLLKAAEGNVYAKIAEKRELPSLKKEYNITSIHSQGSKIYVRFLHTGHAANATVTEPNMEEAYLYCLCQNGKNPTVFTEITGGDANASYERN